MKIIDAHIHFVPNDEHFTAIAENAGHKNTANHLSAEYKKYNIQHAVVMGNRSLALDDHIYPPFLSYCIGLDSYYMKNSGSGRYSEYVEEHLKRKTCSGIKIYPGYNQTYVSDEIYKPLYALAEKYNKPVAIHTGSTANGMGLLKYCHPLTLDDLAVEYPNVQFVMCHLGNPWITDAAAVIDKNKNIAADLSGMLEGLVDIPTLLKKQTGYINHIKTWIEYMDAYDRLMYGTDWPLANIGSYIDFVKEIIPVERHENVFYKNAKRIYGLNNA